MFGNNMSSVFRGDEYSYFDMKKLTTIRVGGKVSEFVRPKSLSDLRLLIKKKNKIKAIIGKGSNTLPSDEDVDGVIIGMSDFNKSNLLQVKNNIFTVSSGISAPKFSKFVSNYGYSGAEFMTAIPGTIGGLLSMNAGCYGTEIWEIVKRVQTIDLEGNLHTRTADDYKIGYRCLMPKHKNEIFLSADIILIKSSVEKVKDKIKSLILKRILSQPLEKFSFGSTFKNTKKISAAKLIESCNLKGYKIGGAQVSLKHANFVINASGTASSKEINDLINHIATKVFNKTGVKLEKEVRNLGDGFEF
jgi:UDP-N-acetylmuramate dehydrogenase